MNPKTFLSLKREQQIEEEKKLKEEYAKCYEEVNTFSQGILSFLTI